MLNTKNKRDQKNQGRTDRHKQRPKTQGENPGTLNDDRKYHEQERPETRMFR